MEEEIQVRKKRMEGGVSRKSGGGGRAKCYLYIAQAVSFTRKRLETAPAGFVFLFWNAEFGKLMRGYLIIFMKKHVNNVAS